VAQCVQTGSVRQHHSHRDRRLREVRVPHRERNVRANVGIQIDETPFDELQHGGRVDDLVHRSVHVDVIDPSLLAVSPGPEHPIPLDDSHLKGGHAPRGEDLGDDRLELRANRLGFDPRGRGAGAERGARDNHDNPSDEHLFICKSALLHPQPHC